VEEEPTPDWTAHAAAAGEAIRRCRCRHRDLLLLSATAVGDDAITGGGVGEKEESGLLAIVRWDGGGRRSMRVIVVSVTWNNGVRISAKKEAEAVGGTGMSTTKTGTGTGTGTGILTATLMTSTTSTEMMGTMVVPTMTTIAPSPPTTTTTMATGMKTLTTSMEAVDGSELCHYPPLTHSC
jgi:hypothetical protein